MNRFGKPGTVAPRCACGEPSQTSASVRPSRPRTIRPIGMSRTWKPVPNSSASTSISRPPVVTIERSRTSATPSVISSTFVARERGIPVVGRQDALAADRVVRRRRARSAPGRSSARSRCGLATRSSSFIAARLLDEAEHHQLARGVDRAAHRALRRGEAPVDAPLDRLHRPRAVGHDPRRRALEDVELLGVGRDLRARTGSPRRRCRSRRSAARAGRRRGPSGRSASSARRTSPAPGSPGSSARPAARCRRSGPSR